MGTSRPREGLHSVPSRHQKTPTTIVMKFTDYTNVSNIVVGALSYSIHRAAGLSTQERADTFIKVRKRQNLIAVATYRVSAANKLLATKKLTLFGNVHPVTSYQALDPGNTRGVLHGVPLSYNREQIRSSLRIPGHKILDFRRMGESQSILITIEGHILPRQAIFCSVVARLYPPRVYCRPCLHCFNLQHRTDVCPTRKEFVRCRYCGTKFPPNQDPTDTPHDCELHCVNCHGDHSATDRSCQALRDATEALRSLTRSIRNRHRYGLGRTSMYGDAGALPGMSPLYRHTPSDRSRARNRKTALNSTLGGDRLRERTCSRSEQGRNQSRQDHKSSDFTPARLQSRPGDLGTTPEQGRIARAPTSTGSAQVTSQPKMTDPGLRARLQCELQSRLKKIYEERDIIRKLLQKWTEGADAVASNVSSVGQVSPFGGPFIHSCATLDGMFTRMFHVYALLSEEDNFAEPELPSVAHTAIAHPSPQSGAQVHPPGANGSCLSRPPPSLNGPSVASSSGIYEAPKRHPSC